MKKISHPKLGVIITMDREYYQVCSYSTIIGRAKSCQITKIWGREKQTAKILIWDQHQIKNMHFNTKPVKSNLNV